MNTMTQSERELHARINAAIREAFCGLLYDFDIVPQVIDLRAIQSDLKAALIKAYAYNHEVG